MRNRRRSRLASWSLGAAGIAALAVACTSQNPIMTTLFDGVPQPGAEHMPQPVVKKPRRPKYQKPPPPVTFVEVPQLPPPTDWKGIYAGLARNENGVAWVKAIEAKQIAPKPSIDPEAKDEEPTDMDVELNSSGDATKALFPHKAHTMWMACTTCHTGIFEMEKGKAKMTMAGMGDGRWCGACHGKVAIPEITACPACHTEMGK